MYNLSQNIKFKFEYIYLIGLILAVFSFTLNITELSETQTAINSIVNILKYIGIGLILLKSLFFTKYKKASPIFWILLLLLLFIIYIHTHNNNLIFIALLSLGAVNVDTKLILKSHIIAQILAIIFTFFLVRHNVIMNLIYYRNNKMRPSFGFVYPTALSAVLFSIVISYVVLKKFTLNIWEYFLIICLIYFTLFVLDARLDGYLMIMIIVSVFLYKKIINVISKLKKSICLVISLFFITLSFLLSYFFNDSSSFFSNLDNIFNNRLSQSHIALTQYPLSLLGQNIQMQGLGGQQGLHQNFTYYFYIDNSFIQILIIDGLILFLIVLFLIITFFIKWHQQRMYILELALLFVCIAAMMEDSLVSAASSIIFIIMMANNDGYKNYIEDNYHEYTTKNEKSSVY